MTPLSASERAAITAAERAGKVQRLPSPCAFSGGRFDRLPNDGEEMEGAEESSRNRRFFYLTDKGLRSIERQVARGKLT